MLITTAPATHSGVPADLHTSADLDTLHAHAAHNYAPLPVVLADGEGVWVTDVAGRRYLDALAGYSALNFGHRHPRLIAAAHAQLDRLTLVSRAFDHDRFAALTGELAALCGKDAVLPMNTGAEAVETAIKAARRWGHQVKGIPDGTARIVVADGNFHGRTTTIVSFSTDPDARSGYGPYTPGFDVVPYGDLDAMATAIGDDTCAVLIEPIQGEGGVIIPPEGYLRGVRRLCDERGVLFLADEIQSGLGRTGRTFACDHEEVAPDIWILGKALGGGIVPLSAIVADRDVMDVFTPGSHGSTFGGNPLACAVGVEVVRMLATGEWQERAARLGERLADGLAALPTGALSGFRVRGLWAGIDIAGERTGRQVCEALLERGVLAKDTHGSTIRLAPPLVITEEEVDLLVATLAEVLAG
jgi:ornithine--oxo-acid transaminase